MKPRWGLKSNPFGLRNGELGALRRLQQERVENWFEFWAVVAGVGKGHFLVVDDDVLRSHLSLDLEAQAGPVLGVRE